jgi:CheY-like chemotaxis protein
MWLMPAATRRTVLVIEDDISARKLYAHMLDDAGFAVIEAHNGLQAVEKAAQLHPNAIVTDLGLPGIDGYELCRRLQRDPTTSAIPVVAITGRYVSADDVTRARREGCRAVLIKPFVAETFVDEIRALLGSEADES